MSTSELVDNDRQQVESDFRDLKQIARDCYGNSTASVGPVRENILEELCRYGAAELHSIAAFIGGCCAQEIIKLITHQYVPINNLLIYNSIRQSINVFQL